MPIVLSVVVPTFNEELVLPEFHRRLSGVLATLELTSEIVYVNDGSTDRSWAVIEELKSTDGRITAISLSRNFGKEIAMTAGLDNALGNAVVVIDADLQDPPALIVDLVREWQAGFDVVFAKRMKRDGETYLKKITARLFYKVIQSFGGVQIPENTGDFRLLSRRAVNALKLLREQHRFMKGLFAWIGFPQKAVPYNRDPRFAGKSKFNYWKLWNFALEGITSFTTILLRIASYMGCAIALFALLFSAYIVYKTLVYGNPVSGYPSLMAVITFLGGVQLAFIGVIGEYLGRMFDESKNRPLYVIEEYNPTNIAESAGRVTV